MGEVRNPKAVTEHKAITAVQPLPQHDPSISISLAIVKAVLSMCIEGKRLCAECCDLRLFDKTAAKGGTSQAEYVSTNQY